VHRRAAASVESKMATMQHEIFCLREFIETESQLTLLRSCALGESSSGGIYVDHLYTMYSSGNIDVRN